MKSLLCFCGLAALALVCGFRIVFDLLVFLTLPFLVVDFARLLGTPLPYSLYPAVAVGGIAAGAAQGLGEKFGWSQGEVDRVAGNGQRCLAEALGDLPEDQRSVVHLKLWEGLTFEAIARLLDIPPNTAASRYWYGIDKLRARLRPLYEEIR